MIYQDIDPKLLDPILNIPPQTSYHPFKSNLNTIDKWLFHFSLALDKPQLDIILTHQLFKE